ncbi:hypothetical protein V8E36_006089 [Tilletia maclaganii]
MRVGIGSGAQTLEDELAGERRGDWACRNRCRYCRLRAGRRRGGLRCARVEIHVQGWRRISGCEVSIVGCRRSFAGGHRLAQRRGRGRRGQQSPSAASARRSRNRATPLGHRPSGGEEIEKVLTMMDLQTELTRRLGSMTSDCGWPLSLARATSGRRIVLRAWTTAFRYRTRRDRRDETTGQVRAASRASMGTPSGREVVGSQELTEGMCGIVGGASVDSTAAEFGIQVLRNVRGGCHKSMQSWGDAVRGADGPVRTVSGGGRQARRAEAA